jgi:hypothetical protein
MKIKYRKARGFVFGSEYTYLKSSLYQRIQLMYVNFHYANPFDLPPTSPIATDLVSSPRAGKFTILHSALLRPEAHQESKHTRIFNTKDTQVRTPQSEPLLNPPSQVHSEPNSIHGRKLGSHHSCNILKLPPLSAVPRH